MCCSEKIQKMKLHWYPAPEPQQLRFSAQYLPTPTFSLAELRPELKKAKVNFDKDNSINMKLTFYLIMNIWMTGLQMSKKVGRVCVHEDLVAFLAPATNDILPGPIELNLSIIFYI